MTNSISERSNSANEVENMLLPLPSSRSKVPQPSGGSGGSSWGLADPSARPRLRQQHRECTGSVQIVACLNSAIS
jgi:hypothetical protein